VGDDGRPDGRDRPGEARVCPPRSRDLATTRTETRVLSAEDVSDPLALAKRGEQGTKTATALHFFANERMDQQKEIKT
jgi:hypothetical protein